MKVLFTHSELAFSKLIMATTGEDVSHVAIELPVGLIIHSNFRGLHIQSAKTFRDKNTVKYEIEIPKDLKSIKQRVIKMYEQFEFSLYDVGALLFVFFCLLARRYLRLPLPKSNLWASTGMFLCTEWVSEAIIGKVDSMTTPGQLKATLEQLLKEGKLG